MLRELRLSAFKCFTKASFALGPLTILAGVNGGGKSTVIQALLVLHQALANAGGADRGDLPLSGPLLTLGAVRDVVAKEQGGRSFGIGIAMGKMQVRWTFEAKISPLDELAATLVATTWTSSRVGTQAGKGTSFFPTRLLKLTEGGRLHETLASARYVPADRVGPSDCYPLVESSAHRSLGPRAERAVGALYWGREGEVLPALQHPSTAQQRLDRQVEAWLRDLFPGVRLEVRRVDNSNVVTLGIAMDGGDFYRPHNVGFGISYALPVIIAILSAGKGDLVLLDSPEAHLHPRAQVAIARLAVVAASAGVQVVVETHSDHVLNAVLVSVHRARISPSDVRIHFFGRRSTTSEAAAHREIKFDGRGRLTDRPAGFFDEIDRQLTALLEPNGEEP